MGSLKHSRQDHEQRIAEIRSAIVKIETKIASEGGTFAKNREQLVEHQASLKSRLKLHEGSLRSYCAGLLPFALATTLCNQVKKQLLIEDVALQKETGKTFLRAARAELLSRLDDPELWKELRLPRSAKQGVRKRLSRAIKKPLQVKQSEESPVVHQLSASAQRQILSWIDHATNELPGAITKIAVELEADHRELDKIESRLRKIPPDEILKPLLAELHSLHETLAEASKQMLVVDDEIEQAI